MAVLGGIESADAQERFFATPNRSGADGARQSTQLQQETNRGIAHQVSITAIEGDVSTLQGRMGTAETNIGTLQTDVGGLTTRMNGAESNISTLQSEMSNVKPHATAVMPGTCAQTGAKLRWNTTSNNWECVEEGDPTVKDFAKNDLPTCGANQLLRSNGSGFTCVFAGDGYVAAELDPKVGATTSNQFCRGTGSQVTCDQPVPSLNETDPQVGAVTSGKACRGDGASIQCDQEFIAKGGDIMDGNLSIPAPTANSHAATKAYVDAAVASAGGGGGGQTCYYTTSSCGSGFQTMPGNYVSGGGSNVNHNICCSYVDSYTCSTLGQAAGGGICVSAGPYALVAATADAPSLYQWGSYGTTRGTTSTNNGAGNTAVLAAYGTSAHPAASYCANLVLRGFSDWYLPAKDELDQLYQAQALIGGFTPSTYWSSSEASSNNAWYQGFDTGYQDNSTKDNTYRVRCVRRAN